METNGLITLQTCVDDALNKLDSYSDSLIGRYLRFAERGLAKLNLFVLDNVRTEVLEINTRINQVSVPADFVRLIRLGVEINGKIYTLTNDKELRVDKDFSCETEPSGSSDATVTDNFCRSDNYCGWNYQLRGGISEYGTYRINNNVIQFGQDVNLETVTIEYVGSGMKIADVTYIPEKARETIIAYIMKERLHTGNSTLGERQEAKLDYYEELAQLEAASMPSFDEIYDTFLGLNTPLIVR